jgi:hypothetical protein
LLPADAAQPAQAGRWYWQGVFGGLMLIMALCHADLWRAERLAAAARYCLTLIATTAYFGFGLARASDHRALAGCAVE